MNNVAAALISFGLLILSLAVSNTILTQISYCSNPLNHSISDNLCFLAKALMGIAVFLVLLATLKVILNPNDKTETYFE